MISFTFCILRVKPMASCRALVGAQTLDQILLLSVILSDIKETRKKLFQWPCSFAFHMNFLYRHLRKSLLKPWIQPTCHEMHHDSFYVSDNTQGGVLIYVLDVNTSWGGRKETDPPPPKKKPSTENIGPSLTPAPPTLCPKCATTLVQGLQFCNLIKQKLFWNMQNKHVLQYLGWIHMVAWDYCRLLRIKVSAKWM